MDATSVAPTAAVLRRLGCRSIHIGGGEPFLDTEALITVARACSDEGLGIDYVETNASWYRDDETAAALLGRLREAGVDTLLISISPFHNEYIPFQKTLDVIRVCERNGMGVFPWGTQFAEEMATLDPGRPHSLDEYESRFGPGFLEEVPSRFWISMRGRAISTFAPFARRTTAQEICRNAGACHELRDVTHFHIDLYGNYVPGVCSGLSIDMDDLGKPLDSARYPLLTALEHEGIGALYEAAKGKYGYTPKPTYTGKCDLCYDVRRWIVDSEQVQGRELKPVAMYSQMDG
jgi:hypothetical protein